MELHLTTAELFIKHPELTTEFNWTRRTLSFFMQNKLLIGYYNRNKRTTMIKENSLLELIDFAKKNVNPVTI